jgi:hypothetical protein
MEATSKLEQQNTDPIELRMCASHIPTMLRSASGHALTARIAPTIAPSTPIQSARAPRHQSSPHSRGATLAACLAPNFYPHAGLVALPLDPLQYDTIGKVQRHCRVTQAAELGHQQRHYHLAQGALSAQTSGSTSPVQA